MQKTGKFRRMRCECFGELQSVRTEVRMAIWQAGYLKLTI